MSKVNHLIGIFFAKGGTTLVPYQWMLVRRGEKIMFLQWAPLGDSLGIYIYVRLK